LAALVDIHALVYTGRRGVPLRARAGQRFAPKVSEVEGPPWHLTKLKLRLGRPRRSGSGSLIST